MRANHSARAGHAALAALSAVTCALAIPNEILLYGSPLFGIIGLVPLYLALSAADSYGESALIGSVFGALHHGLSSFWLFFYKDYAFWTLGSTIIAYGAIYGVAGAYVHFIFTKETRVFRPFVFALGWTVLEFLKSIGFLGYPWGLLPYSLTNVPLFLQIADITGVYSLSFILSLSGACLAELLPGLAGTEKKYAPPLFALFLAVLTGIYGNAALSRPIPTLTEMRMLLVQQNTDPWIAGEIAALQSNVDLASAALAESRAQGRADPELIVFSETSLRRPYAEYRGWFQTHPENPSLLGLVRDSGAALLTGAPVVLDWNSYAASNSTILVSNGGELLESYAKMHPVPFAESIPLWEFAWFRTFMREVVGLDSGWVMGTKPVVFTLPRKSDLSAPPLRFSTPICFEDAFADLCRSYVREGAQLFINLTNDSWSRTKSAQVQHWAIARFRAIENRLTLVRSTNSGMSCVVDPWGRLVYEMPQFEALSRIVDVPVYQPERPTIYTRFGDWFALLCLLLFAGRVIMLFRRRMAHERTGVSPIQRHL